jgi:hypothetical protein
METPAQTNRSVDPGGIILKAQWNNSYDYTANNPRNPFDIAK